MMRTLMLLCALLAFVNCARPMMMPKVESIELETTWTIDVPSGWSFRQADGQEITNEPITVYEAESPEPIGSIPIVVSVVAVAYTEDDGPPERFVQAPVAVLGTTPGVHIIFDDIIDTERGPLSLIVFMTDGGGLVVQLAIVADQVGYIVTCSGDVEERKEVIGQCRNIVTSFTPR